MKQPAGRENWQQPNRIPVFHIGQEQRSDSVPEEISRIVDEALAKTEMTKQVNVAIDGVGGGGKSTLGRALAKKYDCNLFHMDDFFLRNEQRTPDRYAQPGGNVDYERFQAEVLNHLADRDGLTYRPFDCSRMELGMPRTVSYSRLNIIEGSYSCHPYFGDIYQVRFFVDLPAKVQKERILARNGEEKYRRFADEWIPMENQYFDTFGIREKCIGITLV